MLTEGKKALVLSGGGGRGAYHVGVLQCSTNISAGESNH